jgi:hypothetical protein
MGKISFAAALALLLCCGSFQSYASEAAARDSVKYYVRAKGLFHVRLRTDVSSSNFSFFSQNGDDSYFGLVTKTHTRLKENIGFGVGPIFLSFGVGLNGKNPDTNLGLNVIGKTVNFSANYSQSNRMTGVGTILDGETTEIPAGSMFHNCLQANFLFVLNGKRFSFPAAMNQATIQQRSAGSFFICLNAIAVHAVNNENAGWPLPDISVQNGSIGVGMGYGYNWVPVERLLVHGSVTASPGILQFTEAKVNGVQRSYKGSPTGYLTGNFACVYHFPKHFYVGAYATLERLFSLNSKAEYLVTRGKTDAHVALGVRF